MRSPITASALERAIRCPASAVLPRVNTETEEASRGQALHEFLANAALYGRNAALERVAPELVAACEAIPLERLPVDPLRFRPEVALAYSPGLGEGRELGMGLARRYETRPGEIPGTADVLGVIDDAVLVPDFKTGWGYVPPAYENLQLRFLALAAARAHKKSRAIVAIIRIREDGEPWYDEAELGEFEFGDTQAQLEDFRAAAVVQEARVAEGKTVDVTTGPHCTYCPSKAHCPAYQQLVCRMATAPGDVEQEILSEITPQLVSRAYRNFRMAKERLSHIEGILRGFAKEHPIDAGNGLVWGPVATKRKVLDGAKAFAAVEKLHGRDVADKCVERDASQAGIKRGLSEAGIKPVTKGLEQVLAELARLDGIVEKPSEKFEEHRPKAELPEASPALPDAPDSSITF